MDSSPGGSFIPKRNAAQQRPRPQVGKRVYLFSYVAYIFFFGTLLGVVGIFFLNQQADKKLGENIQALEQAQANFNRDSIRDITILDNKLRLAKKTLDEHVSLNTIFLELEKEILLPVQLENFIYTHVGESDIQLEISGKTADFDSVLAQRTALGENELFGESKFTDIKYSTAQVEDGEGNATGDEVMVNFVVMQSFSPTNLAYSSFVADRSIGVPSSNESAALPADAALGGQDSATSSNSDIE